MALSALSPFSFHNPFAVLTVPPGMLGGTYWVG